MKIDCPDSYGGRGLDRSEPGVEDDLDRNNDVMPSGDLAWNRTRAQHPRDAIVCGTCHGTGKVERPVPPTR